MTFPREFATLKNFHLAFNRLLKSSRSDYKEFYRHVFSAYAAALEDNLTRLLTLVNKGLYEPTVPRIVFYPKKSGVLRPLTILSFQDLLVYQAMINYVAVKFEDQHGKHAFKRNFGSIFAGADSEFFFRSWKRSYARFNNRIADAFHRGKVFVAEFDIVSCYELIDHSMLRHYVAKRIKNEKFLYLLFDRCLPKWTTSVVEGHLRHGIPQGPDASAYLAECVLSQFDELHYRKTLYFRYVDDIRLMADNEVLLRRALLKLDLHCKKLGLVPQAQKINIRKAEDVREITKSIPSLVLGMVEKSRPGNQKELMRLFRSSMTKIANQRIIKNETAFKYAIGRLGPRRDVLKLIEPFLSTRPDLSVNLSLYLKKFGTSKEVADLILSTLRHDPAYDAVAANYIEALDQCEPCSQQSPYRQVVNGARQRSEEDSVLIRIAVLKYKGRRVGPKDAVELIRKEEDSLVRNVVINALFGPDDDSPYKVSECLSLLEKEVEGSDEELARYCGLLLVFNAIEKNEIWSPGKDVNESVKLLLKGLGFRSRSPKIQGVLDGFFLKAGITTKVPWRKVLGRDFSDAENRCLRLIQFRIGDPTARILMLDTFNETLVQSFSQSHPTVGSAYLRAIPKGKPHPNYGNWVNNGIFQTHFPRLAAHLKQIHLARIQGDLAHAKSNEGKPTKPISFQEAERLMVIAKRAWTELIIEWQNIL